MGFLGFFVFISYAFKHAALYWTGTLASTTHHASMDPCVHPAPYIYRRGWRLEVPQTWSEGGVLPVLADLPRLWRMDLRSQTLCHSVSRVLTHRPGLSVCRDHPFRVLVPATPRPGQGDPVQRRHPHLGGRAVPGRRPHQRDHHDLARLARLRPSPAPGFGVKPLWYCSNINNLTPEAASNNSGVGFSVLLLLTSSPYPLQVGVWGLGLGVRFSSRPHLTPSR